MAEEIKKILNPYALEILNDWSAEDARYWVDNITSKGLPETITFESAQIKAEESFEKNVGENDFLKFENIVSQKDLEAAKDYYINSFIKKSSKILKEKRAIEAIEKEKYDKKLAYMTLQGHAFAARWFSMMENSSHIKEITKEEIKIIADSFFESYCTNNNIIINDSFRQSFNSWFCKEADMLLRSLEDFKL